MDKKENNSIIRINLQGLDKVSGSAIIDSAKTTRYDPLGMAGFCLFGNRIFNLKFEI